MYDAEKRLDYCKQTPLKRGNKMNLVGIERKQILKSLVSLESEFFRTLNIYFKHSNTCFNRFIYVYDFHVDIVDAKRKIMAAKSGATIIFIIFIQLIYVFNNINSYLYFHVCIWILHPTCAGLHEHRGRPCGIEKSVKVV